MSDSPPEVPPTPRPRPTLPPPRRWGWRSGDMARGALIVLGVWLGLQLLWNANVLVFVVFLGVLFGVAVASGVDWFAKHGVRRGVASALLVFGTVGLLALSLMLLAPTLATQGRELRRDLPEALGKLQALINKQEFGFLDPFLRTPEAQDSVVAADSSPDTTVARARPRPPVPLPPPPRLDTAALAAAQSISQAIDDTLRARMPRPRAVDTTLFQPAPPFAATPATGSDSGAPLVGVLGDTTMRVIDDADARMEARTRFLRDSIRGAMQANIEAAERRAREELLASGIVTGAREPTRSEVLTRRLSSGLAGSSRQLFSLVTGTIVVLGALVMIMFLAIYIGAEPKVYRRWVLAVVPAEHRPVVRTVMEEMATVLRKWLVTQLIAMVTIGVVSTVALLVLDVRAAFALGFLAGLLEFIPTVGPVLAALPAIAMGFIDSPQKALAVVLVYWAIQFLENNLLIPALMRGGMDLPPAITLVAQALMAVLFGFLGLMVAVPLTAAVLVPIRMLAASQDARERTLASSGAEENAS